VRLSPHAAPPGSGTAWLNGIPAHWRACQIGRIGRLFKANGGTKADEVAAGVPCIRYGDIYTQHEFFVQEARLCVSEERAGAYTPIRFGDVLFAASGETLEEIGKSAVSLIRSRACCGGDVIVFRPTVEVDARFMGFATDCRVAAIQKSRMGRGMTVMHIYRDQLKRMWIALPPLDEQRSIASFLDRETERIDALVAKKQRLIELLQEKRTALISHAVTKGLDPDVPMMDSGIEWLGELPANWTASPLMRLVDSARPIMYGIVLPGPDFPGGVPIVKGGDVSPERLVLERLNRTDPGIEARYVRSRLAGGDVVYAIRGSIGAAAVVPDALEGANLTQDTARVAPRTGVDVGWLVYALQSSPVFAQLEAGAVGATIRGINIFSLKRASLPVPPREEQVVIRQHLDVQMHRLDELVASVREVTERLREYRSALITAAVTGQIDVRER